MSAVHTDIRFEAALALVLAHEGGFVDDQADPGGATKYGVSLRTLRALGDLAFDLDGDGDLDADDVKHLTVETAGAFYHQHFWDRYGYAELRDLHVAAKAFDLAVNMGPGAAHRCLQRALRACGVPVAEDGILGPITRQAANDAEFKGLFPALKSEAAGFYRALVAAQPAREKWLKGWLNRAYS